MCVKKRDEPLFLGRDKENETVTNYHGLKMHAADGKMRKTDISDTEQLFRLIQSVPSKKAEPFKM